MMNTLVITEARGALALAGTGQGIVMVVAVLAVLAVIIAVLSRITNRATAQPQAATPVPQPAVAPAEAVPAPAPKPQGKPIPVTQSRGECDLVAVDDKTAAMIMAIVADQMGEPLNTLRFRSIRPID